jgi:hypothetical protein
MSIDSQKRKREKKEKMNMNTAVAVNTSSTIPPVVSSVQDIRLDRIQESKTNPRRTFDQAKLAELASNIRQHGVQQPVLVRPLPAGEDGSFELVAGARRYRASRIAGRETIPASVRELTDTKLARATATKSANSSSNAPAAPFVSTWPRSTQCSTAWNGAAGCRAAG